MQLIKKIVLGTVQLGLPYGINNSNGQPTMMQSSRLLAKAFASGVPCLDTAEAYGNAQEVIGNYHRTAQAGRFAVITKYKSGSLYNTADNFKQAFFHNLEVLGVESLESYLFHSVEGYKNFQYWPILEKLMSEGRLKSIGVSLYNNTEAKQVAKDKRISVVQLPFNLLDNISKRGGALMALKAQGKEVHVRSVFLQGLFYKDRSRLGKLEPLREYLELLDALALDNELNIGALALAYALRQPLIDKVLIGVETEAQLAENLSMAESAVYVNEDVLQQIDNVRVQFDSLLNPVNWS